MDKRELPISMRPPICRANTVSQTVITPEAPIMLTPEPFPTKGKKGVIPEPQPTPPSEPSRDERPGVQVIQVVGKEQWTNKG